MFQFHNKNIIENITEKYFNISDKLNLIELQKASQLSKLNFMISYYSWEFTYRNYRNKAGMQLTQEEYSLSIRNYYNY